MSEAAAPTPPTVTPWKGAWGGAWTVAYGGSLLLLGITHVVVLGVFVRGLSLFAQRIRVLNASEEPSELRDRTADLVAALPEAFGSRVLWIGWADVALASLIVLAGVGILRRSEAMRRLALALFVAEVLLSVGATVVAAAVVLPSREAWLVQFQDFAASLEAAGAATTGMEELRSWIATSASTQLVWAGLGHAVHFAALALLARRVAGPHSQAWCAPGAGGPAVTRSG